MRYLVYQTTNLINGKLYIGVHAAEKLDDGYLGSGTVMKRAIAAHGRDAFERKILAEVESAELMYAMEAQLVDEAFVARDDTYNMMVGGARGRAKGFGQTAEAKAKIKKAMTGRTNARGGWRLSDEAKQNMSAASTTKGKKRDPDIVAKSVAARRENKLKKVAEVCLLS